MCTSYIESQKWLAWQCLLERRNRLCLHRIAWPRKPSPRIKQLVASYHTIKVKVIVHKSSYSKLRPKIGCRGNVLSTAGPASNTWFLRPIQAYNPNGISIGLAVFAQMTAETSCTLQWDAPSTLPQNCPFPWGSGLDPSNTWFPGPTWYSTQTASRSVQPFFAGLTSVTDRPTDRQADRPRYSVGNSRPHLRT